ncbi:TraR/DksA family transcriptional regulator [Leucobacter sp. GX24907]
MTRDEDIRAQLGDLRDRAMRRLERSEAALESLTRDRLSESDDDEHDPEGVPLSAEWSRLAGLVENARDDLAQADDALGRLAEGRYGICAVCGQEIPLERLEVRPFADRCVPCATAGAR